MRLKNAHAGADESDRELLEHIQSLGLPSVEAYRQWCAENGFSKKLGKHPNQRCRERSVANDAVIAARLALAKRQKRSSANLTAGICDGTIGADGVSQPHLKRLCEAIRDKKGPQPEPRVDRQALLRLLSHLHRCRAELFDASPAVAALGAAAGNTFVEALACTARHAEAWLRPVEQWRPRSHSTRRQFASLLRHLFARHDDMPQFFDSVWFAGGGEEAARRRGWYLHVGRGQNVRHAGLPIEYTKKMAHHFMRAPEEATVDQAVRWGQVCGLGGDQRLARALFGTRLTESYANEDFWITVIRWFIEHPMLDPAHVGPIVDYLHHQRFVPDRAVIARGRGAALAAPQPNLTMKGRTPEALLRKVHQWHHSLESDNTQQMRQWQPSGIAAFEFFEGTERGGNVKCWTIRELLSGRALTAEGRQLKHCVATYASSCARGDCSIWTMELETFEGTKKLLTVEVCSRSRQICQARGKLNRTPTEKERDVLRRWTAAAGLRLAAYV